MSSKSLTQLLGYTTLLGLMTNPAGGVPQDILPGGFMSLTQPVDGNAAQWNIIANTRQTARLNNYGAPPKTQDKKKIDQKAGVLIHTYESITHDLTTLQRLMSFDSPQIQQMGYQEVEYQTAEFRRLINNLRVSAIYSALTYGAIYFDGSGNLLPSSSGAIVTVDLGISANHKDQLNGLVGTKWDTATADIIGDIGRIRAQSRKDSGEPIRYAFYGSAIPGFLMGNTAVQKLLPGNSQLATALMSGDIPDGFGTPASTGEKIKWIPLYEAFFNDSAGTDQTWLPTDFVIFTPEPNPSWYRMLEGSYAVPNTLNMGTDAEDVIKNFSRVNGMFNYAQVQTKPPGIEHMAGDTFLPTFTRDVIYQLNSSF